jgi:hypothetical protein
MSEDDKRRESMDAAGFDMQLAAAGEARRREQAAIAARPHKTIDQMDISKVEAELAEAEKAKAKAKAKAEEEVLRQKLRDYGRPMPYGLGLGRLQP